MAFDDAGSPAQPAGPATLDLEIGGGGGASLGGGASSEVSNFPVHGLNPKQAVYNIYIYYKCLNHEFFNSTSQLKFYS